MNHAQTCPNGNSPLPDDILDGFCPRCVVRVAIAAPDEDDSAALSDASASQAPPPQNPPAPLIPDHHPGDRIGRYKLVEKIGIGGMGCVWMAEQSEPLRRTAAPKVIKLGMDSNNNLRTPGEAPRCNAARWPTRGGAYPDRLSFEQDIAQMQSWIEARIQWLDAQVLKLIREQY